MEQRNKEQKIIYSKRIMYALLEKGFRPIEGFPNPTNPQYLCWAFEWTDEFEQALSEILGGCGNG